MMGGSASEQRPRERRPPPRHRRDVVLASARWRARRPTHTRQRERKRGDRAPPRAVDEHGEMKQEAYNLAAYAVEQFVTEMEISKHIKAQFDEKYGPTWHCIVGSDFKLQCTHEAKHFIFFYHGKTAVALYKCG